MSATRSKNPSHHVSHELSSNLLRNVSRGGRQQSRGGPRGQGKSRYAETETIGLRCLQCIACTIRRVLARWQRISCWRRLVNLTTLNWFPRVASSVERARQVRLG